MAEKFPDMIAESAMAFGSGSANDRVVDKVAREIEAKAKAEVDKARGGGSDSKGGKDFHGKDH